MENMSRIDSSYRSNCRIILPLRRMFQLSIVAADLKSDAKYYKDLHSVVESTVSI